MSSVDTMRLEQRYQLPLSEKSSPASFAGQALLFGARSNLLNPPNAGQGRFSTYLGKPLRSIARLVYVLVVPFFAAVPGVLYHGACAAKDGLQALRNRKNPDLKNYYSAKANGHGQAMVRDLVVAITGGLVSPAQVIPYSFFASDSKNIALITSNYFNQTPVQGFDNHRVAVYQELNAKK